MSDRPTVPAPITRSQRLTLIGILLGALALRLLFLFHARGTPGYVWEDPDGYLGQALKLASPEGWRWTFDAVTYTIHRQVHVLPPLYSVFLSLCAGLPGFPLSAQLAQTALAVVSTGLVFELGRLLHSTRAGLLAAAGYACWVPSIMAVWSTAQEILYVPILLFAFCLFARALARGAGALHFAAAGAAFGAAALTRSMPLFFIVPAGLLHVALSPDRRRAVRQAGALLAGFLVVTGPYTAALSNHFGRLTIIDTHGSIFLDPGAGKDVPGVTTAARALWRAVADDPAAYVGGRIELARSVLHVNGGRLLQTYVLSDSATGALLWKAAVHLGLDTLLIVGVCLAGPGAALARRPAIAGQLVLWIAINLLIVIVAGFGGARMRVPFEPMLFVFAAVVVAGDWRRGKGWWLVPGIGVSALAAAAVLPQVPRSLEGRADYGISWPSIFSREAGHFAGAAGFSVPAFDGVAEFELTPDSSAGAPAVASIGVHVEGVAVREVQLPPGETRKVRILWPRRGLAYVELAAQLSSGEPAAIHVRTHP